MTKLLRKHASVVTMLAAILVFRSVAFAQTAVIVEVQVLELSRTELESMGGTTAKPGFSKQLSRSMAEATSTFPRSRVVHRIEVPATSGTLTQVRLDSRITMTSSNSADAPTFYDAGIVLDVTPKVFQNRDISLSTGSLIRIRRGPDANGTSLVMFENPATKSDTRIQEGESVILGGFITPAERMTLPDMPLLPDNPILNYLYPKAGELKDRPEIAILLTPRLEGKLIDAAVDAPVIASKSPLPNPQVTPITTSGSAALTPATSSTPAITSALPSGIYASLNSSPVVTSPTTTVSGVSGLATATTTPNTTLTANPPPVISLPSVAPSTSSAITAPTIRPASISPNSVAANTAAAPVTPVTAGRPPTASAPPAAIDPPASASLPVIEGLGGKYTVQVGAFDQLEKAEALRSQLAKNYEMVFVEKVSTSKTPYRVRIGRFPDMQSARKVEKQLVSDGIDTYVTTLN